MRNATENEWQKIQGDIVHVRITDVRVYSEDSIMIDAEMLEHDHRFSFEIITNE